MALLVYEGARGYDGGVRFPAITIGENERLGLNKPLMQEIGPSWNRCLVMFDEDEQAIKIKLIHDDDPHPSARTIVRDRSRGIIYAKGYQKYFGISPEPRTRLVATYDQSKRIINAPLNQAARK